MADQSVSFDRAADFYDDTRGFPAGIETQAAALIAQAGDLNQDRYLLEIGIGTGRIALPLAQHVSAIHGVDISHLMLKRLLSKREDDPVYPIRAMANHLPYQTNTFDALVASHIFHLVDDLPGVMKELFRVLKESGVLLHCWNSGEDEFSDLRRMWAEAAGMTGRRWVNWKDRENDITNSGWREVNTPLSLSYQAQKTPQAVLDDYEKRIWSSTWVATDEQHAKGVAVVREEIKRRFDDLTTPITVTNTFNVAVYQP